MMKNWILLGLIVLAACAPVNETPTELVPDGLMTCPEELRGAEICTMEYNPVCVEYADGRKVTAGNLCMGCSDEDVVGYTEGECLPEVPGETPNEVTMTMCEGERPEACTREYRPVCGAVDTGIRCITEPCPSVEYETYGNDCTACSDEDVMGHYPGSCEEQKFVVCGGETKTGFSGEDLAANIGGICVAACPSGFDEYVTQIGVPMCILHYGETEIEEWEMCTRSSESCNCVLAYETTDNVEIIAPEYRCVPEQYAERLLFRGGQDRLDENGQQGVMIA